MMNYWNIEVMDLIDCAMGWSIFDYPVSAETSCEILGKLIVLFLSHRLFSYIL